MDYFIREEGMGDDVQKSRDLIASIRIGKVTDVMYASKPSDLLPFKGKFPLVSFMDQSTFLKRAGSEHNFKDLPNDVKLITRKAEKIKWLHNSFRDYLTKEEISSKEFKSKNPKTKQEILYRWLFSNKMDIGILVL